MSSGSGQGTPISAVEAGDTNYCTLAELKKRLADVNTYTATTISFAASGNIISDSAKGLARFLTGKRIQISGTDSNNGYFNIATGGVAASIVTTENLVNESAGDTVTISDVTDPVDDTALEQVIEAVSRKIDAECGRFFYVTSSEARYYTAEFANEMFDVIDDIVSVSALVTDEDGDRTYERTWATTDYDLEPSNAALHNKPYTAISITPRGNYSFPVGIKRGVKITATFGYPSVPPMIREACLLQSMRLWKRRDAIFGVVGSAEMGQMTVIPKLDPDVMLLLQSFRKMTVR